MADTKKLGPWREGEVPHIGSDVDDNLGVRPVPPLPRFPPSKPKGSGDGWLLLLGVYLLLR
jgi:hypothetical protein